MIQNLVNALNSEMFSLDAEVRRLELLKQGWDRSKAQALATTEGIQISDEHWTVINYLRRYYVKHGVPRYASSLASDLNKHFAAQGGSKYLRYLFSGGPVTQGCRLANLRTPACATDASFGTSY